MSGWTWLFSLPSLGRWQRPSRRCPTVGDVEPKRDGFRTVVFGEADEVELGRGLALRVAATGGASDLVEVVCPRCSTGSAKPEAGGRERSGP